MYSVCSSYKKLINMNYSCCMITTIPTCIACITFCWIKERSLLISLALILFFQMYLLVCYFIELWMVFVCVIFVVVGLFVIRNNEMRTRIAKSFKPDNDSEV